MMKKRLAALGLCVVIFPICVSAEAAISIELNGKKMSFERAPFIADGNTLVPMRDIFEALGANVEWDASDRRINSKKGEKSIGLQIGSYDMYIYGEAETDARLVKLEKSPIIIDDFTYVPLRAVAEAFDAQVDWDAAAKTVSITALGETENTEPETQEPLISEEPQTASEPVITEEPEDTPEPDSLEDKDEIYAAMYEGTAYEFVRNIEELTSDFSTSSKPFENRSRCGWGEDADGNGVFFAQRDVTNKKTIVNSEFYLTDSIPYADDEIIDISFDMYCSDVNGHVDFSLIGSDRKVIDGFTIYNNGTKGCVGADSTAKHEFDGNLYFNNNTDGAAAENLSMKNAAHVSMRLNPGGGKSVVTIKNNTNDAEPFVSNGFVSKSVPWYGEATKWNTRVRLLGVKVECVFTNDAKPVMLDNLVTNIIKIKKK
ncbi:MAG: copper amine oxidase N-terminal domain-containing protein [Candidatus Ornithomonoglobus sp.]